jgi:hypothetical protein
MRVIIDSQSVMTVLIYFACTRGKIPIKLKCIVPKEEMKGVLCFSHGQCRLGLQQLAFERVLAHHAVKEALDGQVAVRVDGPALALGNP